MMGEILKNNNVFNFESYFFSAQNVTRGIGILLLLCFKIITPVAK